MHHHHHHHRRILQGSTILGVGLVVLGFLVDGIPKTLEGLRIILTIQDLLITDYIQAAGFGAAMVNAGLVTLISVILIWQSGDPCNGFTIAKIGLMAGFSLFGKNILNIWPIIGGTWLYAKFRKEPFSKYLAVALLATALAPLVSYMAFESAHKSILMGTFVGLLVGFLLPPLSTYTFKILNGMNLYNMGFACGLLAMMIVPMLTAIGDHPQTVLIWSDDYTALMGWLIAAVCLLFIALGWIIGGKAAWHNWVHLLKSSGRAPSDYLLQYGDGATMINIGMNGLIGMAYILIVGGELNGPTVGGVFTMMGFAAYGKHARNVIPIMLGVALGAFGMHRTPSAPGLQLAGLFGTTLAPIAGQFGSIAGVIAGFIHSALVVQTGVPVAGLNLYNNGFSGGLITVVLYPLLSALEQRRNPTVRNQDYFEVFMADEPEDPEDVADDDADDSQETSEAKNPEQTTKQE